jgi:hypothetical protein
LPVIINEFEVDMEGAPAKEGEQQAPSAAPAQGAPAPMAIRDKLEQMRDREMRLDAW